MAGNHPIPVYDCAAFRNFSNSTNWATSSFGETGDYALLEMDAASALAPNQGVVTPKLLSSAYAPSQAKCRRKCFARSKEVFDPNAAANTDPSSIHFDAVRQLVPVPLEVPNSRRSFQEQWRRRLRH